MSKILEYKGYYGEYEYNAECDCWQGKIKYIDDDTLSFESKDRVGLNKAFKDVVEDYISCKETKRAWLLWIKLWKK